MDHLRVHFAWKLHGALWLGAKWAAALQHHTHCCEVGGGAAAPHTGGSSLLLYVDVMVCENLKNVTFEYLMSDGG